MTTIPINNMSIKEKIAAMEMIWDDLCQNHSIQVPDWHQNVLQVREEKRLTGQEQPMDWSEAKKHILKKTQ